MRVTVPNLRRERLRTDPWGLRRTIGRDGRELIADGIGRDEPVDILLGGSFCFGVGASGDETTLASALAQRTGRATLNLGGYSLTLAQNFIQFMFFCGRYANIRNVVIAGFNEIFHFYACDAIFRRYGMFLFNTRFLEAMNGALTEQRRHALFGAEQRPFLPLTHRPENEQRERALLNSTIEETLGTLARHSSAIGARLVVMTQPTALLQQRKTAPEEDELFAHYDAASGIAAQYHRAVRSHAEWHRADMTALAETLGFDYVEINDLIGSSQDGAWLFVDRVHMTDLGYATIADILAERLAG